MITQAVNSATAEHLARSRTSSSASPRSQPALIVWAGAAERSRRAGMANDDSQFRLLCVGVSFFFRAAYLVGFKPWDSGVPPPQLVAVVEGSDALLPQKALDLGCGTGTNSIYMARHGWDVTGIDFVPRAVSVAKRKAAEAQASPRLMVGDVTRLTELGIGTDYSLLLDLGQWAPRVGASRGGAAVHRRMGRRRRRPRRADVRVRRLLVHAPPALTCSVRDLIRHFSRPTPSCAYRLPCVGDMASRSWPVRRRH